MSDTEQTISRRLEISTTTTLGLHNGSIDTNSFEHLVRGPNTQSFVIYEIDWSGCSDLYFSTDRANIIVNKVELVLWHNEADFNDPIKEVEFVEISDSYLLLCHLEIYGIP